MDKFYDGKTLEELKPVDTASKPELSIDERVKEAIEVQKVSDMLQSTIAQLPDDLKEKFKQEYDDIAE